MLQLSTSLSLTDAKLLEFSAWKANHQIKALLFNQTFNQKYLIKVFKCIYFNFVLVSFLHSKLEIRKPFSLWILYVLFVIGEQYEFAFNFIPYPEHISVNCSVWYSTEQELLLQLFLKWVAILLRLWFYDIYKLHICNSSIQEVKAGGLAWV